MVGLQSQQHFIEIKTASVVYEKKNEIKKNNLANLIPAVVLLPLWCSKLVLFL